MGGQKEGWIGTSCIECEEASGLTRAIESKQSDDRPSKYLAGSWEHVYACPFLLPVPGLVFARPATCLPDFHKIPGRAAMTTEYTVAGRGCLVNTSLSRRVLAFLRRTRLVFGLLFWCHSPLGLCAFPRASLTPWSMNQLITFNALHFDRFIFRGGKSMVRVQETGTDLYYISLPTTFQLPDVASIGPEIISIFIQAHGNSTTRYEIISERRGNETENVAPCGGRVAASWSLALPRISSTQPMDPAVFQASLPRPHQQPFSFKLN